MDEVSIVIPSSDAQVVEMVREVRGVRITHGQMMEVGEILNEATATSQ